MLSADKMIRVFAEVWADQHNLSITDLVLEEKGNENKRIIACGSGGNTAD